MQSFRKTGFRLLFQTSQLASVPFRSYYYPDSHHLQQEPHLLVKRIVKCVGARLREIDPQRWEGVPFTFKTNWLNLDGTPNIVTCIHVHDAVEREFNIDIDDRKILLVAVNQVFDFISVDHKAL